jgi:hypothetical protein
MSSLSFDKLTSLLNDNGFLPLRIFNKDERLHMVQCISVKNARMFMIVIPKEYKIKADQDQDVIELKYLSFQDTNEKNLSKKYADEIDLFDFEANYPEILLPEKTKEEQEEHIEDKLMENYKRPIFIRDLGAGDVSTIKDVFRQVRRLRLSIQTTPYRLVICYKRYICVLNKDDTIEGFISKSLDEPLRKIIITVTLDYFVNNLEQIEDNITRIEEGLTKTLDKNVLSTIDKYNTFLTLSKNNLKNISSVKSKKDQISNQTNQLIQKLDTLKEHEQVLKTKLKMMSKKDTSFYGDMSSVQGRQQIVKKMDDLYIDKTELLEKIVKLRETNSHMTLMTDKILFDNIVMLNSIINNLKLLDGLSNSTF